MNRKNIPITAIGIFLFLALLSCEEPKTSWLGKTEDLKLWYNEPAENWMKEALPIGNGYLGAMVFGGIHEERIQFNEESLWAGGPGEWEEYRGGNRENAHRFVPEVRDLLKKGDFDAAHQLANKELTGIIKKNGGEKIAWEGFGCYQTFGDVMVKVKNKGEISDYYRDLNLTRGAAHVRYKSGTTLHERKYFANYPSRILVMGLRNDNPNGTDYTISFKTPHENTEIVYENGVLILSGQLENNGMKFESMLEIRNQGGEINFDGGVVSVERTKELMLILTAATDYLPTYPSYTGRDFKKLNREVLAGTADRNFQDLYSEHLADYQSIYNRVSLDLGGEHSDMPTDKRILAYKESGNDPQLERLFFQYGRYLMLGSSRRGSMPANLQGKWNHSTNPPWASDYHFNINVQMIYWPAEVTNMSECHEPLLQYIETLQKPGEVTARNFFNTRGWIVNTMNNAFGFTATGWEFPWGFFPGGAAWLSQHMWEHYEFTQDEQFLKEHGFPVMRNAALFWLDYLFKDADGTWVSAPSYSPEHGGISMGASMDHQMVWDLFTNYLSACEVLGVNDDVTQDVKDKLANLSLPRIGRWGQLQEWKEDRDDPDNKHRHVSHLFALHPGKQISVQNTPELAEAAKVSLNARGDEGTGWSLAWKINFWARLGDGNRAHKLLTRALQYTDDSGTNMMDGGGVYGNMLSAHPPFQLDGNMGATAGIAEMLLQSHAGVIELLPALSDKWPTGEIKGLKARGAFELDIQWEAGVLKFARIKSLVGGTLQLKYKDNEIAMETSPDTAYTFDGELKKL
ncbi:glycoside hydrolase family 95 protein [Fulvivirgaceae bacterium BMA10]|uniref:Glycoside hydrolase family 95 protein n=1 Tax=Splendidivirga corallicola TaxID=3051826 RepID=A0ABT8KQG5_9BACT|nr:glycoside hydrolase family 95 protein [Fulvivirgaceae bacterium BMA10]